MRNSFSVAILRTGLIVIIGILTGILPAVAGPTSTNYELKDFAFGGGGTTTAGSTNFSLFGLLGETSGARQSSTNYKIGSGLTYTVQANVPPAPSLTNPANYYNKLQIVLATGGNPTDATFAIAISSDNFATDTRYIQNDNSVGSALGPEDWQTYSGWGGASGVLLTGLVPNTTYTVKVAAKRGNFTETAFGPTGQAATVASSLTFDIDVSPTDSETSPPFTVALGALTAGSVTTSNDRVWVDVDTNGTAGATVYVYGSNNGLRSTAANYTITAASANLVSASEGYGARGVSVAQTSGGPMAILSPYNGSGDTVGTLDGTKRVIFDSSGTMVTAGRASFHLKAKSSSVTRAGGDYGDTLTLIASAAF